MPYRHYPYWVSPVQIMLQHGQPLIMLIPLLLTLPTVSRALKLYSTVGTCKAVRKKTSSASYRRTKRWRISFSKKARGCWKLLLKPNSKRVLLLCSISIICRTIIWLPLLNYRNYKMPMVPGVGTKVCRVVAVWRDTSPNSLSACRCLPDNRTPLMPFPCSKELSTICIARHCRNIRISVKQRKTGRRSIIFHIRQWRISIW